MANQDKKGLLEEITPMDVDFAKWYTDICKKAELVEYTKDKFETVLAFDGMVCEL